MFRFEPQPTSADLPAGLASPFEQGPPHPLARRAAELLTARLDAEHPAAREDGKMYGVLVVAAPDGAIGWLAAFSGMLGDSWLVDGFCPPLFDTRDRDAFWPAGEAQLMAAEAAARDAEHGSEIVAARAALAELEAVHDQARQALSEAHALARQVRRARRAAGVDDEILQQLARESRGHERESRDLRARLAAERAPLEAVLAAHAAGRERATAERHTLANQLLQRLYDGYRIPSARGAQERLWSLFAPHTPPGGAGDCAAPKLFAQAFREGLRPLALAELWWGRTPAAGGRHHGTFYPACRGKCGVILPFMLDGLDAGPAPTPGDAPGDAPLAIVFEDDHLVLVDKPAGLLSVPGRFARLQDCVIRRLAARGHEAHVVHRLDLDVSGLMLVAKTAKVAVALRAQFARREVHKRYLAVLDGVLPASPEEGEIHLALRGDLADRPRQIVDPAGKPAITAWRRLGTSDASTRVALWPHTGRSHQLRVHAQVGLGHAIVGDRLYGRGPAARLMLHAEGLAFAHPVSGKPMTFERPAPF